MNARNFVNYVIFAFHSCERDVVTKVAVLLLEVPTRIVRRWLADALADYKSIDWPSLALIAR